MHRSRSFASLQFLSFVLRWASLVSRPTKRRLTEMNRIISKSFLGLQMQQMLTWYFALGHGTARLSISGEHFASFQNLFNLSATPNSLPGWVGSLSSFTGKMTRSCHHLQHDDWSTFLGLLQHSVGLWHLLPDTSCQRRLGWQLGWRNSCWLLCTLVLLCRLCSCRTYHPSTRVSLWKQVSMGFSD